MSIQQLDLFDSPSYYDILHGEIVELRGQVDHYRKSFFGRQRELSNLVMRQQGEIDRLRELLIKSINNKES